MKDFILCCPKTHKEIQRFLIGLEKQLSNTGHSEWNLEIHPHYFSFIKSKLCCDLPALSSKKLIQSAENAIQGIAIEACALKRTYCSKPWLSELCTYPCEILNTRE